MRIKKSATSNNFGLGEGAWTPGAMEKVKSLLAHHIDYLTAPEDDTAEARARKVRNDLLRRLSADELSSCAAMISSLQRAVDRWRGTRPSHDRLQAP